MACSERVGTLLAGMLAFDARDRPPLDHVLAELGAKRSPALGFAGRDAELAVLERARDSGEPAVVWLEGHAGYGKTALLQCFLRHAAQAGALVLESRCALDETVPFRALDGAIDDLAEWLRAHPDIGATLPLTDGAYLFPALAATPERARPEVPLPQLRERAERAVARIVVDMATDRSRRHRDR